MIKSLDIVTGFFESGKTTFVKKLLEKEANEYFDKILVINCEFGEVNYLDEKINDTEINVVDIFKEEDFTKENINSLIKKYNPEYIIIEFNGVWDIKRALEINYTEGFIVRNIISIVDYTTFDNYFSNMESIMVNKISDSDLVVFTKTDFCDEEELEAKYKAIKSINKACGVYMFEELFRDDEKDIVNKSITKSDFELIKFGMLFVVFNLIILGIKVVLPEFFSGDFQRIMGIFISLIIQILPFLLIGSIVSSLIQVFVSKKKFNEAFRNTSVKSIFMALFAGAIFPVCDCAMTPIVTSVVKKGYSIPVAITFLLASPAVNPIVIISTYYAFPNAPKMVIYRILFGLLIAFLMGMILVLFEKKYKGDVVKDHLDKYKVSDSAEFKFRFNNKLRYLEAIIEHTKKELFKIGFYVVLGAFLSACLQVLIPKSIFLQMNEINAISVLAMVVVTFFISVCSTSNAFIARAFYNIMPMNAILAFVVMGPMLEITNISILMGTFKKKYVFMMIGILVYISFVVFSLLGGGFRVV